MLTEGLDKIRMGVQDVANVVTTTANDAVHEVADIATETATELRDAAQNTMRDARDTLPSLGEVLSQAVLLPGVQVSRVEFLTNALRKHPIGVVRRAIETSPRRAGISPSQIWRVAGKSLGKEARRTTAVSVAAGIPGGFGAAATIPADLVQLYGHLVRAIQMLSYLYGWRDTCAVGEGTMDEATRSALLLFLGVMSGDKQADAELRRLAPLRETNGVRDALLGEESRKVIAGVSGRLEERMAHRLSGQVVGKSVPLAGAIISGTMSYGGFSDMWKRLRAQLAELG